MTAALQQTYLVMESTNTNKDAILNITKYDLN